jgi:glucose-6-phosphate isomerase
VGVFFDYSKNRVNDQTINLLLQLAEESGLRARIDAMFRGEKINIRQMVDSIVRLADLILAPDIGNRVPGSSISHCKQRIGRSGPRR